MSKYTLNEFPTNGFVQLGSFLEKSQCDELLAQVNATRNFDSSLFLTKEEFENNPQMKGVNPTKGGYNLAEKLNLDFIEQHPVFIQSMEATLGSGYEILLKKFVMGTPESIMPQWVLDATKNQMVANLGPYIRPKFRDITYFHGIDWHQDIIDYSSYVSDFITLYVYLSDTTVDTSPLYVIPKSHLLGATVFPHIIEVLSEVQIRYTNDSGATDIFDYQMLLGKAGSVNFWHSLTLHGTQPHINSKPRISLRYLIQKKVTC